MNKQQFYFLLPYCFIVKGEKMNIIFNAQKNDVVYIPDCITTLIELFNENNIEMIEQIYNNQKRNFVDTITFLKRKGLIGIKNKEDIFPQISFEYDSPEHIKHLVVEYSNRYNFDNILFYVNKLLVKFIEIRYKNVESSDDFIEIEKHLSFLYRSTVKAAQLVFDYKFSKLLYEKLKEKYFNIANSIIFYNSPYSRTETWGKKNIQYIKAGYDYIMYSNNDYKNNYILDFQYFILSHSYNPYYYKRLCIDENGSIKNCLKSKRCFGNVKKDDIMQVVQQEDFRELWSVSCDKIIDIKDNPMRYNMYVTNQLKKEQNGFYSIIQ